MERNFTKQVRHPGISFKQTSRALGGLVDKEIQQGQLYKLQFHQKLKTIYYFLSARLRYIQMCGWLDPPPPISPVVRMDIHQVFSFLKYLCRLKCVMRSQLTQMGLDSRTPNPGWPRFFYCILSECILLRILKSNFSQVLL